MAAAKKKSSKKKPAKPNLQPLGDRIVVQREVSEDTTAGGIFLPTSAQNLSLIHISEPTRPY